ncbi:MULTISPECIES: SPOR domain-containing protein [unclassified Thioalkalivibrio]|uniref:SPOR domain-containing protein n=1 Tax=unclassified Thioalkalivibrio TaxID=2621013 RepID=UPI0003752FBC|nr:MULTISPECIES: SPOR domain-containing protein [unclassified Thioalkalivibrio]
MAQARKVRRKPAQKKERGPLPGWIWLLAGLLIGLGVAAVLYLQGADRPDSLSDWLSERDRPAAEPRPEPVPDPASEREPEREEPRFRYYELLPEDEVTVPDAPARDDADTDAPPAPLDTPDADGPVVLQTGSFRRAEQADEMRARLTLLGLSPEVREAEIDGDTWYRVYLGPYSDPDRTREVLERLRSEGIEALRLRDRG